MDIIGGHSVIISSSNQVSGKKQRRPNVMKFIQEFLEFLHDRKLFRITSSDPFAGRPMYESTPLFL